MNRWKPIATSGTDTRSIDWTNRIPSGASLSSVAYAFDPNDSNLSTASNSVSSNVSSIAITASTGEGEYLVKCTPTLDTGSISPISIRIKIVKHKET